MGMAPQPGKSLGDVRNSERSKPVASVPAKKAAAKSPTVANPVRKALGIKMPDGQMRDSFMGVPAKKK
jgi:hypothetical protein